MEWIEIQSEDQVNLLRQATIENIHPLVLEDCLHRDQKPKLEDYGAHQFLVWFLLLNEKIHEFQMIIFENKIILVTHDRPPSQDSWKAFFKIDDLYRYGLDLTFERSTF